MVHFTLLSQGVELLLVDKCKKGERGGKTEGEIKAGRIRIRIISTAEAGVHVTCSSDCASNVT